MDLPNVLEGAAVYDQAVSGSLQVEFPDDSLYRFCPPMSRIIVENSSWEVVRDETGHQSFFDP